MSYFPVNKFREGKGERGKGKGKGERRVFWVCRGRFSSRGID